MKYLAFNAIGRRLGQVFANNKDDALHQAQKNWKFVAYVVEVHPAPWNLHPQAKKRDVIKIL